MGLSEGFLRGFSLCRAYHGARPKGGGIGGREGATQPLPTTPDLNEVRRGRSGTESILGTRPRIPDCGTPSDAERRRAGPRTEADVAREASEFQRGPLAHCRHRDIRGHVEGAHVEVLGTQVPVDVDRAHAER